MFGDVAERAFFTSTSANEISSAPVVRWHFGACAVDT